MAKNNAKNSKIKNSKPVAASSSNNGGKVVGIIIGIIAIIILLISLTCCNKSSDPKKLKGQAKKEDKKVEEKKEEESKPIIWSDYGNNSFSVASETTEENIATLAYTPETTEKDTTKPVARIAYSVTEPTNGSVIVTIMANEEIKEVDGWTLSDDKKSLSKEFTSNDSGTVTITDLAGNTNEVSYEVSNIDDVLPTADTYGVVVNGKYIITLSNVSEEITDWDDTFTKEFDTKVATVDLTDTLGNVNSIAVNYETNKPNISSEVTINRNNNNYERTYTFIVDDESDILVVKFATDTQGSGLDEEYFATNGTVLNAPYTQAINAAGNYYVYAEDVLGNKTVYKVNLDCMDITSNTNLPDTTEGNNTVHNTRVDITAPNGYEVIDVRSLNGQSRLASVTEEDFMDENNTPDDPSPYNEKYRLIQYGAVNSIVITEVSGNQNLGDCWYYVYYNTRNTSDNSEQAFITDPIKMER